MRDDGAMKKASDRALAKVLIVVLQLFNQWGIRLRRSCFDLRSYSTKFLYES